MKRRSEFLDTILEFNPNYDIELIGHAYDVAEEMHRGQLRKSGEPYLIHPMAVAEILADLGMDEETIVAGLLHDVVEDTSYTEEELIVDFGEDVAMLVDGVTKLASLKFESKEERQAENLRKMFLAMSKDIRVLIIKLSDRLHNLRTINYMTHDKIIEKCRETLDIYAPLAARLGMYAIKMELEDIALKFLEPEAYYDLAEQVSQRKGEREDAINDVVERIDNALKDIDIHYDIYGRSKHFYSIYKKMKYQHKTLDEIFDLMAVRIIVDSVKDCYAVLGLVHTMWTPIPGRFKDYIAMPKPNMYQSLHTTVVGDNGKPFEIQIRTYEMHKIAEYGIAAHWKYKEASNNGGAAAPMTVTEEEKLSWLRQILEWQRDMSDNKEFMSLLKSDLNLFSDTVFCFTPSGDVKNLPTGSTPVDFAYSIHSAVGNKMIGAKVNGKLVPIDYEIQNGDRIEIITSQNSKGPSRDWLNIVKSTQAKNKINQWFKKEFKESNIIKGKEMIVAYCKAKSINVSHITNMKYQETVQRKYGFKDWDSVLAAIGHGGLKEGQVVNRLVEEYSKEHKQELTDESVLEKVAEASKNKVHIAKSKSGIVVKGIDDVAVRFSKCCSPIPGDEIVGFVTRGRGITIHRTDCVNVLNMSEMDRARLIEAEWQPAENKSEKYMAEIQVYANNRTGLLVDLSKIFTERKIDMRTINSRTSKQEKATISISFEIASKEELSSLIAKIRQIESVLDVERTTG